MRSKTYGAKGLLMDAAGEIVISTTGLWTGSCRFTFPAGAWDLMPRERSSHPLAGFLLAETSRVIFTPGRWTCLVDYAGTDTAKSEPVYELSPGVGSEPIETHPDFISKLAGRPSAPLNGALWVDPKTGIQTKSDKVNEFEFQKFQEFLGSGEANPMAGVRSFLQANNTVWSKRWTQRGQPAANNLMKIGTPDGPCPSFGGSYTWLEFPIQYTGRGGAWSCEQRWMLSGSKGWNALTYP